MTGSTILVVEDSETIRSLVVGFLSNEGHRVIEADDFDAAVSLARAEQGSGRRIDMILCDVILPGPSGLDVAVAVVELHPDASIVFMSGGDLGADTVRPQGSTMLDKPFKLGDLRAVVTSALS